MSKYNKTPYSEIALPINNTFLKVYYKKGVYFHSTVLKQFSCDQIPHLDVYTVFL